MAMARDGLLPPLFSDVNRKTQVPILSTVLIGICAAILAFFMDVSQLAGMVICYLSYKNGSNAGYRGTPDDNSFLICLFR
jgi:amino acid transporter